MTKTNRTKINIRCGRKDYGDRHDFVCGEAMEFFKLNYNNPAALSVSLKRFSGAKKFKFDNGGFHGKFRWFDKKQEKEEGIGMRPLFEGFSNFLKAELFPNGEYPKEFFAYVLIEPR